MGRGGAHAKGGILEPHGSIPKKTAVNGHPGPRKVTAIPDPDPMRFLPIFLSLSTHATPKPPTLK